VVLSANTPLFAQAALLKEARRQRSRFVFWLQDLISVAMSNELRRRLPGPGHAMGRYLGRLERRLLRQSDAIVAISDDFVGTVVGWGVPKSSVRVIENWAPLDELPVRPRRNAWSAAHGLDERVVVLYAGTLGLKHNPELLVALARALRDDRRVTVIAVSEGAGADYCRQRARADGLDNLLVLPFQPYDALPDMLATSDILAVILEPAAGTFSVPSKVLTYLCAGRPILGAMPAQNPATRLLRQINAGAVSDPGSPDDFVEAGRRLIADMAVRQRMGQNGRIHAEKTFDITLIADQFLEVLGVSDERAATRE
jgi:colanic acid biosynthesis glycosyl transferase WcaI